MKRGHIFIISGPSGVGKGTIIAALLERHPELWFSVSATTRPIRNGEVDGREYFFVSHEEFRAKIERGEMLEWAEYEGQYYGTPADRVDEQLNAGHDVILDIESNGMRSVTAMRPDAVTIFIAPPSFEVLEQRLRDRGTEVEEKIIGRLLKGRLECEHASDYAYLVLNDDLETAIREAEAILLAESCRTQDRIYLLKGETDQ